MSKKQNHMLRFISDGREVFTLNMKTGEAKMAANARMDKLASSFFEALGACIKTALDQVPHAHDKDLTIFSGNINIHFNDEPDATIEVHNG